MIKAPVRRNRAATAELADAWQLQHASTLANGAPGAALTFDRACAAYLIHVGTRSSRLLSPLVLTAPLRRLRRR